MSRPAPQVSSPAPAAPTAPTSEVPAYVDDLAPEAAVELEVPRLMGADAESDEIDLPDFLR